MAWNSKRFRYAIFSNTGNYILDWTDVVSEPSFSWSINNGPAELIVKLARPFSNFGEGYDIIFENQLQLYAIDKEAPNGILIYSGRLNEYRPHFSGTDATGHYLEVQFLGWASTLGDQLLHDRTSLYVTDYTQSDGSTNAQPLPQQASAGWGLTIPYVDTLAFPFRPDISNITGIQIPLSSNLATHPPVTVGVLFGDINPNLSQTVGNAGRLQPGNVVASGVIPANSIPTTRTTVTVLFPQTNYQIDFTKYYYAFVSGSGINAYVDANPFGIADVWGTNQGAQNRVNYNDLGGIPALNDLQFDTLFDSTVVNYVNQDPTSIVQDIIQNKYTGPIQWDTTSINTGSTIIYQFNKQTILAAIGLMQEMAPPYFYWRLAPNNKMVFTLRDWNTVNHTLRIGFEVVDVTPARTVNNLTNRVIFYGGSLVGQPQTLFVEDWVSQQSAYTLKEKVFRDSRVIYDADAQLIARDYLDDFASPATNLQITVLDSNGDNRYGYDIESFLPGQMVSLVDPRADGFKNFSGTWDNINWDGDNWDEGDMSLLASPLQIQNIEYKADTAILTLSNQLDTAPKKIQDNKDDLIAQITGQSPIA